MNEDKKSQRPLYAAKARVTYNTNLTLKQRYYPISSSNTLNILIRQGTNGITKAMNYILEGVEYFIFKAACALFTPDLLNRVHFRGVGRNIEQVDISRYIE